MSAHRVNGLGGLKSAGGQFTPSAEFVDLIRRLAPRGHEEADGSTDDWGGQQKGHGLNEQGLIGAAQAFARLALEPRRAVAVADGLKQVAREAEGGVLRALGPAARMRRVALAAAVGGATDRPHVARGSAEASEAIVARIGRVSGACLTLIAARVWCAPGRRGRRRRRG